MFEKLSKEFNKKPTIKSIILTVIAVCIISLSFLSAVSSYADGQLAGGKNGTALDLENNKITISGTDPTGASSAKSSLVIGNILEEALDVILFGGYKLIDFVLLLINSSFVPSLSPLLKLEKGESIAFHTDTKADTSLSIEDSKLMTTIWRFSFAFAIITATLIVTLNLFLCIAGRSDDIKDTPVMLLVKYCIAIFLIFTSRYFMVAFINLYGDIWNNIVLGGNISTFDTAKQMGLSAANIFPIARTAGQLTAFKLIVDVSAMTTGSIWMSLLPLLLLIVGLVCAVTLLKEILKLFLEIVERYFVFMLLVAFFPIMAATLSSNNSKRIFYSYIKIVYTQGFLLIINTIFMSIFFYIGMQGGWIAGFLNYLAALAFLRLCQRIDAYMSQMGIGVVQTGSALANAVGHSGIGLLSAMRAFQMADRGRQNVGKGVRDLGVKQNSSGTHAAGSLLGSTIGGLIGGQASTTSMSTSFASEHSRMVASMQNGMGAGITHSLAGSNGSWSDLRSAMMANGMNELTAANATNAMAAAGYQPTDISSMTQNDKGATSFSFNTDQDGKGGTIATTEGLGDGENTQVIPSSDMEDALKQQESMEQGGSYGDLDPKYTEGVPISSDMDGAEGDMERYIGSQQQADAYEQGSDSLSTQDTRDMSENAGSTESAGAALAGGGETVVTGGADAQSASEAMSGSSDAQDYSTSSFSPTSKGASSDSDSERGTSRRGSASSESGSDVMAGSNISNQTINSTASTTQFNPTANTTSAVDTRQAPTPLTRQDRVVYTPGKAGEATLVSKYGNTEVQRPIYAVANHPEMRNSKQYDKVSYGGRDWYVDNSTSRPSTGKKKKSSSSTGKNMRQNPGISPTRKDGSGSNGGKKKK